jgi:alkanesulfonate monooxygenase SsuD/methylene tetrahydromethanopterin reductase-like flavin-dependent oxidoreductase (luciferase family)
VPIAAEHAAIVEQVLRAERAGLDLVGIQDHPYQRRFVDTFVLIADLLARTERIRFFPDVASLPMRPPAMLAKAAASLDLLSGGRFELGIGAGTFWEAVAGMGGTVRHAGERLGALEEALSIVRAALDAGTERSVVRNEPRFYPEHRYPAGPPPAHRVEIWVGAMAPASLRLVGRVADGWVPGGGISRVADFPALIDHIETAAADAGRDPGAIRRIVNLAGAIGPVGASAGQFVPGSGAALSGPPAAWSDTLAEWATDLGIDSFVLWPAGEDAMRQIDLFASDVAPAVRSALHQPG